MPKSWAKDVSDDEDEEELLDYEVSTAATDWANR